MISANPLDASLLDRFERKIQFHYMDWEDEGPVVKAKFPALFQRFPAIDGKCREVTQGLREQVQNGDLYGEFSHRALCSILSHATDMLEVNNLINKPLPVNLLGIAARVWLDGLPDEENRDKAKTLMDAQFKTLDDGNTAHINPAGLKRN